MNARTRLGHVAIEVSDLARAIDFYRAVLGAEPVSRDDAHRIVMLRAPGSDRFHDLALHEVARAVRPAAGACHIAWEVETEEELRAARDALASRGAVRWAADFGVSRSVFGADPDGNPIEIAHVVPEAEWEPFEASGTTFRPLSPETLQPRS